MKLTYYKTRTLIFIIVLIAASFVVLAADLPLDAVWRWLVPAPTAIVGVFLYFHNKYLWKHPVLSSLVTVPNLNGTYTGHIEYCWDDKDERKDCKLTIKQTASSIKVSCRFRFSDRDDPQETRSTSQETLITRDEFGTSRLLFRYTNEGLSHRDPVLDKHDGFIVLDVEQESKQITLEGDYFTKRVQKQTRGRMKVTKVSKGVKKS